MGPWTHYDFIRSTCLRPSRHRAELEYWCHRLPVLCLGLSHQKRFKNKTECWRFFGSSLCASASTFILLFKNNRKTIKNPCKINKNRGLGRSRGPLGGHLGAFWPPWAPKAEKVPKKLVRCPPLGVPRGTLKSHFFVFFAELYITFF